MKHFVNKVVKGGRLCKNVVDNLYIYAIIL
jgi:hypothetical protein